MLTAIVLFSLIGFAFFCVAIASDFANVVGTLFGARYNKVLGAVSTLCIVSGTAAVFVAFVVMMVFVFVSSR